MRQLGKILWWDRRDAEGIIVDSAGNEFYFNASVFAEHSKHKSLEGRFVEFFYNQQVSHAACAQSVKVVPQSSQSKARKTFESGKQIEFEGL